MSGSAYYNEFNKDAAEWLRNLIKAGHIAPGEVDERSIEDVHPADLRGYKQCHFFAGVGVWSYALRRAGWSDDRPVWTGSCPCQPFSSAGEGAGFADERHQWPAFHHLIRECRPPSVYGEQVASRDADAWLDLVHTDLEALEYAFGAVAFPSAGVGAPHIRDRTYWAASDVATTGRVGHANVARSQGHARHGGAKGRQGSRGPVAAAGVSGRLADLHGNGCAPITIGELPDAQHYIEPCGGIVGLADADRIAGVEGRAVSGGRDTRSNAQSRPGPGGDGLPDAGQPGPTNGFWRTADWLGCRDDRWRPVESGTFPLVDGLAAGMGSLSAEQRRLAEMAGLNGASLARAKRYRVASLHGYGNAINAEAAIAFINATA